MEWQLDLDPSTESRITIHLFRNVENAEDIRKRLFKGELNCCIIKPSLIVHPFQVAVAANKALVAESLTTKTVNTEILFNLSTSKNITTSLKMFGLGDNDKELLVASINKTNEVSEPIDFVKGEEVSVDKICEFTDFNLVKKTYKITEVEYKNNDLLDSVVSRMAIK